MSPAWLASLLLASALGQGRPGLVVHADPCLELDDAQLHEDKYYRGDA